MKTRKRTIFVLLALALTACDNSNILTEQLGDTATPSTPLTFATTVLDEQQQPGTRASGIITTANISSMGVFACYTGQGDWDDTYNTGSPLNYMYNESLSRTGSGPWTYSPVKYWPNTKGDKVSFFAYAPHTSQIPENALRIPGQTSKGQLEFLHLPPDAAEDQFDLLVAYPVLNRTKGAGPITFTFKHVTAQIIFHVKSSTPTFIQSITMNDVTTAAGWAISDKGLYCNGREVAIGSHHTATINQNIPADVSTKVATFFAAPCAITGVDMSYNSPTVAMTYGQDGNTETLEAPLPVRWKEGDVIIFTLVLDKAKLDVTVTDGGGMTWGGSGTEEEINDSTPII